MLWIIVVEWLARLVLLVLVLLSGWSVTIIIERYRYFKNLSYNKKRVSELLKQKKINEYSSDGLDLVNNLLLSLKNFNTNEKIEKGFDVYIQELRSDLEQGLPVLGTLGSTTPFIGLLGTILGIIVSFGALSNGSGDMNSVMLSLAEALILTAVGLIVAIPAVVGFNYFSRKARAVMSDLSAVKDLYIAYKD